MKYYCEYCGYSSTNAQSLLAVSCMRHPNGAHKGKHKLYEGGEKSQYLCKYCGMTFRTLADLTAVSCMRHPNGSFKGKHAPAL